MIIPTKYEVLKTRDLTEVEIYGLETIVNQYIDDLYDGHGTLKNTLYYCGGLLYPESELHCDEGRIERVGMVSNRIVVEIELTDDEDEGTDEFLMYFLDPAKGGHKLYQIELGFLQVG
jgi:hypothetical protein